MKAKMISIGVLLVAVIWFTIFLYGTIGSNHGKLVRTYSTQSIECSGWGIGSWANTTCESVTSKVERFQDGHLEITMVERDQVKPKP